MGREQAKPGREELERKLIEEAQKTVEYLEHALREAPDDKALKERLEAILEQARSLRDKLTQVIERAKQRRISEEG